MLSKRDFSVVGQPQNIDVLLRQNVVKQSEFVFPDFSGRSLLVIQAVLVLIDIYLFTLFLDRPITLLSVHTIITLFFSLSFRPSLSSLDAKWGVTLLGGVLAFFLPVAGLFCLFVVSIFMTFKPLPPGNLLNAFQEHLHEGNFQGDADSTATMNPLKDIETLEPLSEMLMTKDPQLKRAILEAISQRRNPKLTPLLVEAIRDPRPEIYQFAIAKVAERRHEYTLEITRATKAVETAPDNMENHHRLVKAYRQYLSSGLVNPSVADFYLKKLYTEIEKKLSDSVRNSEKAQRLGQFLLEKHRWRDAEKIFRQILIHQPDNAEAQTGLLQTLYRQKGYQQMLKEMCHACEKVFSRGEKGPVRLGYIPCSTKDAEQCQSRMSFRKALFPVV